MNCEDAQAHIQSWLDGDLSAAALNEARGHIDKCPNCRSELADYAALQNALRALPAPAPPPDLTERLWAAQPRRRSHWPTLAIAASLLIAVTVFPLALQQLQDPSGKTDAAEVQLPLNQSERIELALSAPRDLKQVQLTLELPPHLELKGFPSQRVISWRTDLQAGNNRLALPVKANAAGSGELVARIQHEGKSREMRVRVISNPSTSSGQWAPDVGPLFNDTSQERA